MLGLIEEKKKLIDVNRATSHNFWSYLSLYTENICITTEKDVCKLNCNVTKPGMLNQQ